MSGWSIKDAVEMERRHVLDGEDRVARQEALAANVNRNGNYQLAFAANDLLGLLRESLEVSKTRLRDLEGRLVEAPAATKRVEASV